MKQNLYILSVLAAVFVLSSCNQEPIFYNISNETKPDVSQIPGIPSSIALYNSTLYASNTSRVWKFEEGNWQEQSIPGIPSTERVQQIISNNAYLFVRTVWDSGSIQTSTNTRVYRTDMSTTVALENTLEASHPLINALFVANDTVIGSVKRRGSQGGVRYVYVQADSLQSFGSSIDLSTNGFLSGAAWASGLYYLATSNGVYTSELNDNTPSLVSGTANGRLSGIQAFGSKVLAWGRDSVMYEIENESLVRSISVRGKLDSSHAIYDNGSEQFLVIAYHSGTATAGYREIRLQDANSLGSTIEIAQPGDNEFSTIIRQPQYRSSLGRHAIYSIYHHVDTAGNSILFAGTNIGMYYSLNRGDWKIWSTASQALLE